MKLLTTYLSWLLLITVLAVTSLFGGTSTKKVQAVRAAEGITIDGYVTDAEWSHASPAEDFQQFDPVEGAQPTERTSVRVLYDDNALYIGVICYDSDPSGIVKQLTRRDRTTQTDRFSVIIDSYHDHRTAFLFGGSVAGVQSDGILSNDGVNYDVQWDAVFQFKAATSDNGWSAEFRIPFSALRFNASEAEYEWGLNFRRYIARKKETDEWVMVPRKETPPGTISSVSRMGHLTGIRDIHPPLHVEVVPYQVSKASYLAQPSPFPLESKYNANVGLDLKYGVTNNVTFDMAINPDFGQVEVDKAVLNLTVFETFYPEKRPFFLEGSQIFDFGTMFDNQQLRLFYSRRIGRRPSVPSPSSPDFNYSDVPQTTRILGAGKLTGRTNNGLSVGVLSALTAEETAAEQNLAGFRNPPVVLEPRGAYNVVRLRQDIAGNSTIGMMATMVGKESVNPRFNGGFDWNIRPNDGRYAIDGYIAGSEYNDAIGIEHSGAAGRLGLGTLEGEHWLGYSFYDFSSPQFNINSIGYYSQPREHGGFTELTYKNDDGFGSVRRYSVNFQTDYRWNWDRVTTTRDIEVNPTVEFTNFWSASLDYYHQLPAYDDANRLGTPSLYLRPVADLATLSVKTDLRKPISFDLTAGYRTSAKGLQEVLTGLTMTARPTPWIEIVPALSVDHIRAEEAWVYPTIIDINTIAGGRQSFNLFGDRDIDEYDFSLSTMLTFSPDLSLQFFGQVLLAKGEYANFRELTGPESFSPVSFTDNADFNEKTLNANLVLRWQYLPGSTFYLVWTQARYGDNGVYSHGINRNFSDTFTLPMDNVLLAKFTYWWSL